jgi:hypothetical protein
MPKPVDECNRADLAVVDFFIGKTFYCLAALNQR